MAEDCAAVLFFKSDMALGQLATDLGSELRMCRYGGITNNARNLPGALPSRGNRNAK